MLARQLVELTKRSLAHRPFGTRSVQGGKALYLDTAMPPSSNRLPTWATSTPQEPCDSLPMEFRALGDHFEHCSALCGPAQALRRGAGLLQGVVAARTVTAAALVAVVCGLWWVAF